MRFSRGDLVRYRSGRVVWEIVQIVDMNGWLLARLENQEGTRRLHAYVEDLKLVIRNGDR